MVMKEGGTKEELQERKNCMIMKEGRREEEMQERMRKRQQ